MWEEHRGASSLVRTVWRAEVEAADRYPIAGSEYWGISFIRRPDGAKAAELDGPRMDATTVEAHVGECYWGVELAPHVAIVGVPKEAILGATVPLPVDGDRLQLGERWWPLPEWPQLEAWVSRLAAEGGLLVDDDVRGALLGERIGASDRTWQRRFRRTVGLTRQQVVRLQRARHAYVLLQQGTPPAAAAVTAGFADQPHLTRALRLIRGETPAAIVAAHLRST